MRGAFIPKEAKGFSYSGELKLIRMMYVVQVCEKSFFFFGSLGYVSILFLLGGGGGCIFTVKVAFCNWE